jgi:GNAT superfamily N-acetyltransferase
MVLRWATRDQRPALPEIPARDVWPEYNLHGDVVGRMWHRLDDDVRHMQSVGWDDATGDVLVETNAIACVWDGTDRDLRLGIDAVMRRACADLDAGRPPTALCALAAQIAPAARSRGLAAEALRQLRRTAAAHGFAALIAPVRPSWKERYPLTPIDEYATWRRDDGLLFDPWMRVHERLGARIGPTVPRSLRITGTVAEWEAWTGLPLPASDTYVFPHGLAPLHVDREVDHCIYWEPNVWFIHDL